MPGERKKMLGVPADQNLRAGSGREDPVVVGITAHRWDVTRCVEHFDRQLAEIQSPDFSLVIGRLRSVHHPRRERGGVS